MKNFRAFVCLAAGLSLVGALEGAPARQGAQSQNSAPIYQVRIVDKTITAISYEHRNGSTDVGFRGTPLLQEAKGTAKVTGKQGRIQIDAEFKDMVPAQTFGPEYITYVLWAITPEGKPSNLGEVILDGNSSKLNVTTPLQTFGMIVTAEPYFAVSEPSNVVVLENVVLESTTGTMEQVTASYELLDRGQYAYNVAQENRDVMTKKSKTPLEIFEARNAVAIAQNTGAQQYAPDAFAKAQNSLQNAESLLMSKGDRKVMVQDARDAVQNAADARLITVRKIAQEQEAARAAAQAQQTAQAQADAAAAEARRQQEAEAAQQSAAAAQQSAAAAQQADAQRRQAEQQAAQEAAARAQAEQQAQQAAAAQAQAQAAAERAQQEAQQLRAMLLAQFNRILPTTDTPQGLQVNLGDVLFDTAKYNLREPAKEALAKFSGIVLSHPGLNMHIEGYTDSIGDDAYNLTLSENRANAVRAYLVSEGLDPSTMNAEGFGKSNPVADNGTAQGRQMNRRVEIIISGSIIGTQIGGAQSGQGMQGQQGMQQQGQQQSMPQQQPPTQQ